MRKTIRFAPPVADFIAAMSKESERKLRRSLTVLREIGFLVTPNAKKLKGYSNLFELRIMAKGNERIFYAYADGDQIWLLHGFVKKTDATPQREIEQALRARRYYIGE